MGRLLNVTVVQDENHYVLTRVKRIDSISNIAAYESEDGGITWEHNLKNTDLLIESEYASNKLLYILDKRPSEKKPNTVSVDLDMDQIEVLIKANENQMRELRKALRLCDENKR